MERFNLQPSKETAGYWVLTDTKNKLVCKFKEHEFNDTQEFKFYEEPDETNPATLAQVMREIGDWVVHNHSDIVF